MTDKNFDDEIIKGLQRMSKDITKLKNVDRCNYNHYADGEFTYCSVCSRGYKCKERKTCCVCNGGENVYYIRRLDFFICPWCELKAIKSDKTRHLGRFFKDVASNTYKDFTERLCKDREPNDPVVIAVKAALEEAECKKV